MPKPRPDSRLGAGKSVVSVGQTAAAGHAHHRTPVLRWPQRVGRAPSDLLRRVFGTLRPCRHHVGDRWFVDETYVKVAGVWRYVYRAVDQHGQVIDIYVSRRRNTTAARRLFDTVLGAHDRPTEITTDLAAPLLRVIDEVLFDVVHDTEQYANNRVETDHGRLKARLRPMRGLKRDRTTSVVIRGHAFIQNLRRGHYELGINARTHHLRARPPSTNSPKRSDPATAFDPMNASLEAHLLPSCATGGP